MNDKTYNNLNLVLGGFWMGVAAMPPYGYGTIIIVLIAIVAIVKGWK